MNKRLRFWWLYSPKNSCLFVVFFLFLLWIHLRAASHNASIWMEVSPLVAPCGPPSLPKTDISYACIIFFFCRLIDVDCAATALFQTQQCGADAVMEVGGRGTTWPKTVLLKGLFAEPPACCCLPVVQWKQRCSLPPIHHLTAPLFFMNKIWFGLTYFFTQCRPVPLTQNVSSGPIKIRNKKKKPQ